ncbi:MAG: nitroreductase family protein [Erysipelotrichaceae bacterium]|nr:nitroreductase family protein [Erysipelotrichaceae bacterium]
MNTLETIKYRKSVRKYTDQPITDEQLHEILLAAMTAPSCTNARDWSFIVVRDKETLHKMADCNGKPAQLLKSANIGILVCGDLSKAFQLAKDYWIIDCSIACENMILAATDLGIGSVWLGTYPQMDRVNNLKELFNLPENIVPHSIISFGYPEDELFSNKDPEDRFDETCVHYDKWL